MRRCCLIHLKNSSTCHRHRYRAQMVSAGNANWLVRNTRLAGLGIAIADAAQVARVVLGGIEVVKGDGLVADEPRVAIHRRRVHAPCIEVSLGARDEEASRLIERVEPLEVQVTPIHDVEGTGLDEQKVQYIDVVHLAVRDVDEGGKVPSRGW